VRLNPEWKTEKLTTTLVPSAPDDGHAPGGLLFTNIVRGEYKFVPIILVWGGIAP